MPELGSKPSCAVDGLAAGETTPTKRAITLEHPADLEAKAAAELGRDFEELVSKLAIAAGR